MTKPTVTVTFSAYDFGCLRGLLTHEIDNVERRLTVVGYPCAPADKEMTDAYLRQLRSSLATVEEVYDGIGAT
ncbi:hypothetical protein NKI72_26705 [Mesorhizobium sp. M0437]|uniref:hypothetical protein n=1 Tax=Mesorhizobium sp. M0437 TaxID=2956945 RepID=UPI000FE715C4|nr:MAG: hypothetical protein EOS18_03650 [Mesorhizobium sp.]